VICDTRHLAVAACVCLWYDDRRTRPCYRVGGILTGRANESSREHLCDALIQFRQSLLERVGKYQSKVLPCIETIWVYYDCGTIACTVSRPGSAGSSVCISTSIRVNRRNVVQGCLCLALMMTSSDCKHSIC
jgi:hypothetical protein